MEGIELRIWFGKMYNAADNCDDSEMRRLLNEVDDIETMHDVVAEMLDSIKSERARRGDAQVVLN